MHSITLKALDTAPLRVHHVGIAVRDIRSASEPYKAMGIFIVHEENIQQEQVKVAFLQVGDSLLEFLEPLESSSHLERFLNRRGEGLHHIAIEVQNIEVMQQQLKERGIRLTHDTIRTGAKGYRCFFVHPASTGGILLEIVEATHRTVSSPADR